MSQKGKVSVEEDELAVQLRACEQARCKAISDLDVGAVEDLLDEDLSHTHANGLTQDRRAYLAGLTQRPRMTRSGPIHVRRHGDMAILTGTLTNSFVAPDGSSRTAEVHALRVWRRAGDSWRLLAFAASGPLAQSLEQEQ